MNYLQGDRKCSTYIKSLKSVSSYKSLNLLQIYLNVSQSVNVLYVRLEYDPFVISRCAVTVPVSFI